MSRPVKVSAPTYTSLPPGIYQAKLESITDTEEPHPEYGMGLIWKFVVDSGSHLGEDVERLTGTEPTAGNICGRLYAGCMGIAKVSVGDDLDLDDAIGQRVNIVVKQYKERTRVEDVMPLTTASAPVASAAPRPPSAPPKAPPRPGAVVLLKPKVGKWWSIASEADGEGVLRTQAEIEQLLVGGGDPDVIQVCKDDGKGQWMSATDAKFEAPF
mgnify:CR=1 FL=1